MKNINTDDIKINIIGENDDYKYLGSFISKVITSIGTIWLLIIFLVYYNEMISRESDHINFTI